MPVTPQKSPPFPGDLPGDAHHPRGEPIRLSQPPQVPIGPQETLLRQVLDCGPVGGDVVYHRPDQPGVAVIEATERLAVSRQNASHQVGVSRLVTAHRHHTSGRRGEDVQSKM